MLNLISGYQNPDKVQVKFGQSEQSHCLSSLVIVTLGESQYISLSPIADVLLDFLAN